MNKVAWPLIAIISLLPIASYARDDVSVSLSVQDVTIQDTIAVKLSGKSQWAIIAAEVETGKELINTGSGGQRQFIPGSLMKLFVTAAVLEQNRREAVDLGTVIAVNGNVTKSRLDGDIIVRGAGNAFLTTMNVLEAVEKIKSLGIKEISGNLIIDDSLFDVKEWKLRFAGPAYGVPSAFGLDMHTVSIAAEGGNPHKIAIDPPNDVVKVSVNPSGKPGIRQIDDLTYEVTGATLNAPIVHKRFSLADPALYAGGTLMTLIKKSGIRVAGNVKRGLSPSPQSSPARGEDEKAEGSQFKKIVSIGSQDINAYICDTNQQSLNVAADNLLFLLGAKKFGAPGTKEKGIRAINEFLSESGVSLAGLVIDDGGGISELNRVSAEQMVGFLQAVLKKSWFKSFSESLSRPGIDGRLQDFGYRSDHMRLKSGQVRDAYCLAGYVDQKNGHQVAFAFMINGPDANAPTAGAAAVEVLKHLEQ